MSEDVNEEAQKARRETLTAFIERHFDSVNAFANELGRKQPQISETLKGSRSFGEKLARSLELEVDDLRKSSAWAHLPPLRFDSSGETHPKLAVLIARFESIRNEENQDLLIEIAGTMANKSSNEAAATHTGRDSPERGMGSLQPDHKAAPKKRRRE